MSKSIMTVAAGMVIGILTIAGIGFAGEKPAAPAKPSSPTETPKQQSRPLMVLETSEGNITIELWPDKAPISAKNFAQYAEEKFYDGTIFHRVINGFMIQGGGMTSDMKEKPTRAPIKNEANPELKNDRGTLAMARTGEVDSATAQFFINHKNNDFLNQRDRSQAGFGYAVFGKVVEGMDVVDKIAKVKTTTKGFSADVPEKPVVIQHIGYLNDKKK